MSECLAFYQIMELYINYAMAAILNKQLLETSQLK